MMWILPLILIGGVVAPFTVLTALFVIKLHELNEVDR
jgi:hypothetical protein